MVATGEKAPLLGGGDSQNYYFLNPGGSHSQDGGEGEAVEVLPEGATAEEFAPRVLGTPIFQGPKRSTVAKESPNEEGFLAKLFGVGSKPEQERNQLKPRKAPIKVEPKVFFANERTFLAWMHVSIILAGASIAILAFSNKKSTPGSQIYGLIMLPVSVSFILYSLFQYTRRAYMLRNKLPGPYDDTVGPTVLGILLMMSIVSQFLIKLNSILS